MNKNPLLGNYKSEGGITMYDAKKKNVEVNFQNILNCKCISDKIYFEYNYYTYLKLQKTKFNPNDNLF